MKKSNFLRTLVAAVMVTVSSTAIFAQVTAPGWTGTAPTYGVAFRDSSTEVPAQATNIDTVTVGSVMPYMVKGDPIMHQLRQIGALQKSDFNWALSGGGTLTAPAAKDTVITVTWGTAPGLYNITVAESPVAATGFPTPCAGTSQKLPVRVVARPTVAWNGSTTVGGCNVANTTVGIPVDVTGIGKWVITYDLVYYNLSNVATSITGVTGTDLTATIGLENNKNDGTALTNQTMLSINVPSTGAGAYGKYVLTIKSVKDRISTKSGVSSSTGDYPSGAYTIVSYPAPTTQPIQHIKNL